MSKITDKQHQIIKYLRQMENETAKRSEIINQFRHWYYCNEEKHISDVLHRMVKSGLLVKPKSGFYKVGEKRKSTKENPVIENQINIFDNE
jgi:hypothetical protein